MSIVEKIPLDELHVNFCEAKWGGIFRGKQEEGVYLPEIGSCLSSLFIIWMGCHMLIFWVHPSGLLRHISSTFVVNGVSSFIYHYTNYKSWLHIDGMSMLFVAWLVFAYIIEELIQNFDYKSNVKFYSTSTRMVVGMYWFIACGVGWWMIADAPFNGKLYGDKLYNVMFAIPLVMSIMCTFYMMRHGNITNELYLSNCVEKKARVRYKLGVGFLVGGVIMWTLTENLCDDVDFFKIFPGHMLWHIVAGWGMSNCLLYASLFRADNFNMKASINIGKGGENVSCFNEAKYDKWYVVCCFCLMRLLNKITSYCCRIYFFVFPAFTFHSYRKILPETKISTRNQTTENRENTENRETTENRENIKNIIIYK